MLLPQWLNLARIVDISVMIPKFRSSVIHIQCYLLTLEDRSRICLIFGVKSLKEFNKFSVSRLPRERGPGFNLERLKLGTRLSMSFALKALWLIFIFVIDILFINDVRGPHCSINIPIFASILDLVIFEDIGIVEVTTLHIIRFHNLLECVRGRA